MGSVFVGHFRPGKGSQVDSLGKTTGGNGGGGTMLETRVARLESDVEYIRRDMAEVKDATKILMADTTDIKVRLEKMAGRQDAFDIKLDAMDKKFESKFDSFESKLDVMDKKFESKFDGLDKKFATKADLHEALSKQQQWMFRTLLALVGATIILTSGAVAAIIKYMPHTS